MRKLIAIFLAVLLFALCFTACSISPIKLTGEKIHKKISPSTVEIYAESESAASLGTGFYIDDAGTVVTNYHVIQNCSSAYITTNDASTYEVTGVVGYSEKLDVAILSTTSKNSVAVETCTDITTGETVYVLGSSLGLTGTFSEGLISTAERDIDGNSYIQISAPISHGNSGGPVVNTKGQVIGIASAGFEDGQNLNLAIPISVLDLIKTNAPLTMEEFFAKTRVAVCGSAIAVRTVTFDNSFWPQVVIEKWKLLGATEEAMIVAMDEYAPEQGGGQLYIIDPGVFIDEIDEWCFAPNRKPGDCEILETSNGYTICYFSARNTTA